MLFLLVYKIMSLSMRDKMDEIILGDIIFTPLKRTLSKGGGCFQDQK
ncbi:putative regulatory membrane protein [Yersinia enterocolitica]|nr:putative regulatory membrane protein [Yersinia enterocolitica]CNG11283.1 putative regulatory membrane protein [Yersinia enterocolitica]CNI12672.1 putative regulatory membrane protein [Yersinia enterocolitica]CNI21367.1 putative regulatory membrane protein [Yersinia enterocolitica]CNI90644.1 putative regulatory membrane protein [Yersinia enterocolitica]